MVWSQERHDSPEFGRGSGLSRPADILIYSWRGDFHCRLDLVDVSRTRGC